ncbi:MAG: hypothetical protein KDM64_14040, partial [Verrucomicrobiae bacterium]|nr:hypothetical protein [Verrucomicrobiae bacterium]
MSRNFPFASARGLVFGMASMVLAAISSVSAPTAKAQTDYGDIALRVAEMLEDEHYLRHPFDDEMSERLLDIYIDYLDFSRVYFTQQDIDRFNSEYRTSLDEAVRSREIGAAYDIYGIYKERVRSRVALVKELLDKKDEFHFDSDRTVQISRKEAPYAKDGAEYEAMWHDLIEAEVLQETLRQEAAARAKREKEGKEKEIRPLDQNGGAESAPKPGPEADSSSEEKAGEPKVAETPAKKKDDEKEETPREIILKRYDRILDSVNSNDAEDVAVMFIKSMSRAYDPHSEYFSQSQY